MITHHTAWHVAHKSVITVDALPGGETGQVVYHVHVKPTKDMAFAESMFTLSIYGPAHAIREAIARIGEELATAESVYDEDNGRMRPEEAAAI